MKLNSGIMYNGDCLEVMATLPDDSVDLILTDLPYGSTECQWDNIIPFEPLWEQYWRILKPEGTIVLTATQPFTTKLISSQIDYYKYNWIWNKTRPSGFVHAKNMPMRDYEDVCVFSKGCVGHKGQSTNRMAYYPQGLVEIEPVSRNGHKRGSETVYRNRPSHKDYTQTSTNYPRQVLRFPSVAKTIHPTQKPTELFEYLIKTYTTEGMVVMDSCSGSGTTAIAAENTNRKWICIEKSEEYFNKSIERIKEHNETLQPDRE
jgi:site-specific DNA-methyltransferase (adenine-specific)